MAIYAIGLGKGIDRPFLEKLAAMTNGEAYFPSDVSMLAADYKRVVEDLRRRYIVGYTSTNSTRDGKWRNVELKVADRRARHREPRRLRRAVEVVMAPAPAGDPRADHGTPMAAGRITPAARAGWSQRPGPSSRYGTRPPQNWSVGGRCATGCSRAVGAGHQFRVQRAGRADRSPPSPRTLRRRVATSLIDHKGDKRQDHPAIVQDSSLQGWTWHDGSFSWVEPTAWCMLALKKLVGTRRRRGDAHREAETLLRDRMCEGGGWNYGNREVYGQSLPIHVPPTAAGVMALQDRTSDAVVVSRLPSSEAMPRAKARRQHWRSPGLRCRPCTDRRLA